MKLLALGIAAVLSVGAALPASAGDVGISFNYRAAPARYYRPAPVYVRPATTVVVRPATRVVYAPAPVQTCRVTVVRDWRGVRRTKVCRERW